MSKKINTMYLFFYIEQNEYINIHSEESNAEVIALKNNKRRLYAVGEM